MVAPRSSMELDPNSEDGVHNQLAIVEPKSFLMDSEEIEGYTGIKWSDLRRCMAVLMGKVEKRVR